MAKITTFEVGYCTHVGCMALRGAGLRVCNFPSRAYLLEAGNRRWLWDTGYADHFRQYTQSGIFQIYRHLTPMHLNEGESLIEQMRAGGYAADDFQALIISHFHADHIAGLRDFDGLSFICSGEGWSKTRGLRGFSALKHAFIPGLIPPGFEEAVHFMESFKSVRLSEQLLPFKYAYELPDSRGEIFLVPLPGHAAGHIGAFVLTESGWTLLASDAAWTPSNYQLMAGPSLLTHLVMESHADYYRTQRQLNQLWVAGQVDIRLCHEGDL